MSTRSNTVIKYGETVIYLYRHCDGDPVWAGAELLKCIKASKGATDKVTGNVLYGPNELVRKLLASKSRYRITTDFHGDIEWAYIVRYSSWHDQDPTVEIMKPKMSAGFKLDPRLLQCIKGEGEGETLERFEKQIRQYQGMRKAARRLRSAT